MPKCIEVHVQKIIVFFIILLMSPVLVWAADFPVIAGQSTPWRDARQLGEYMSSAPAQSTRFEGDLFKASDELGNCPGWLDGFSRFANNFARLCSRDVFLKSAKARYAQFSECFDGAGNTPPAEFLDRMKKCKKVQAAFQQIEDTNALLSGNTEGLSKEDRDRHEKLQSSVQDYLKDVAVCTIKAGITSVDMRESRRRDWEKFIDGARIIETGLDASNTFIELAEKVATEGRSAFLENFTPQSLEDWADVTQDSGKWLSGKIEEFTAPFGTAAGQVADLLASSPAIQTGRLYREIDDVSYKLDSCEFDQAILDAEVTELKLKASIVRYRRNMAFYRHREICAWNAEKLDGKSIARQADFLDRVYSNFDYWKQERKAHDRMVQRYDSFREKFLPANVSQRRSDFDALIESELSDVRDAITLSIRECGKAGKALPLDTLQVLVWSRRDRTKAGACRAKFEQEADKLIDSAIVFETMFNRAHSAERDIKACRISQARKAINSEIIMWQSATSKPTQLVSAGLNACWGGGPKAALERLEHRNQSLIDQLKMIDATLQQLRSKAVQCDASNAQPLLIRAQQGLNGLECPLNHKAITGRRAQLVQLEQNLGKAECQADQKPPDKISFVVRVSGSGFTPHYAGGSYKLSGYHDLRITVPYGTPPGTALAQVRARYNSDPCKAEVPAIPGLSKIPVLFNGAPGVVVRTKAYPGTALPSEITLENTWKASEDDGPSLRELRPASCK